MANTYKYKYVGTEYTMVKLRKEDYVRPKARVENGQVVETEVKHNHYTLQAVPDDTKADISCKDAEDKPAPINGLLESLMAEYEKVFKKPVPNRYRNDEGIVWIKKKLNS